MMCEILNKTESMQVTCGFVLNAFKQSGASIEYLQMLPVTISLVFTLTVALEILGFYVQEQKKENPGGCVTQYSLHE